jgi:hypothetical protein
VNLCTKIPPEASDPANWGINGFQCCAGRDRTTVRSQGVGGGVRWIAGAALIGAVFCAADPVTAQDRPLGFPATLTSPPDRLPPGCSESLVAALNSTTGTDSYKSLHREVASLKLGHSATQELQTALNKHDKAGSDLRHEVILMMTGLTDAQNTYLCAAFVAGQQMDKDPERKAQAQSLVSVCNRMALQAWRLENVLSSEAAGAKQDGSSVSASAAILDERKEAGADLVGAVAASERLTMAAEGGSAPNAKALRITCAERSRLLAELVALDRTQAVDEFTSAGALLEDFLRKPYRCAE